MSKATNINPEILAWAREAAGLDLTEAAKSIGITASKELSAEDKLAMIEAGDRAPTRKQLVKIAAVYRRPLVTFYLKNPPVRGERGEDFRRAPAASSRRENAMLDTLLRDIRARQEMVRELLEDDEDYEPNPYVGIASIDDGVAAVAGTIANAIQFDHTWREARKAGAEQFFSQIRSRAEAVGFFVLLVGDLGSHHSALSDQVFRGFAIADRAAPFIVINDQDARAARSFTLIHELAHIVIGESGVSGEPATTKPANQHERVERFCNDVAGEFLLPSDALRSPPEGLDAGDVRGASQIIERVASLWCVSEPMVAYRFDRLGWINEQVYGALVAGYAARWQKLKREQKEAAREDEGGPSYYVVRQNKLGNALLEVVCRTVRENVLTHTKAAKVLGVKTSSVEPLLRGFEHSRGYGIV